MSNNYSQVNSGTTISAKTGYDIVITAALANFTANGVNVAVASTQSANISNAPLRVSGNVTNATIGTIFYYYVGNNSTYL